MRARRNINPLHTLCRHDCACTTRIQAIENINSHASWVIVKYLVDNELDKHAKKLEKERKAEATAAGVGVESAAFKKGEITADNAKLPKEHKLYQYHTKGPGISARQKFILDVTREVISRAVANIAKDEKAWDVTPKRAGKKRRRPASPVPKKVSGSGVGADASPSAKKSKKKSAPAVHAIVGLGRRKGGSVRCSANSDRCGSCYARAAAANDQLPPHKKKNNAQLKSTVKYCISGCHACGSYICMNCVHKGVYGDICAAVLKNGGLRAQE